MIDLERNAGTWRLTIRSGKRWNALGYGDLSEFQAGFREILAGPVPRALILTGEGEFVGGLDVSELANCTPESAMAFSELGQEVCNSIEDAPFPVIAAVNGLAIGGGLEIATACDVIIAASTARFIQVETLAGLTPGFGGTWRLQRHVGPQRAGWMTYTGQVVDAKTAMDWGLVFEVVEPPELLARAERMCQSIEAAALAAIPEAKRLLRGAVAGDRAAAGSAELQAFGRLAATIEMHQRMEALLARPLSLE